MAIGDGKTHFTLKEMRCRIPDASPREGQQIYPEWNIEIWPWRVANGTERRGRKRDLSEERVRGEKSKGGEVVKGERKDIRNNHDEINPQRGEERYDKRKCNM